MPHRRRMSEQRLVVLRLIPIAVLLAAAAAGLAGFTTLALVGALVGIGALFVLGFVLRRPPAPVPEPGPVQAAALRERRDRDGEVAAVEQLRDAHPGLSLVDAVRLVRGL
jgi:hypothetical protein